MPFADPRSTLLDEMARRRAEAQVYRQQMLDAAKTGVAGVTGGLELQASQQAAAEKSALAQKQQGIENERAAADLALRRKAEARMGQDSALRQRAQAVDQAQAQAREAREAQESALRRKIAEQKLAKQSAAATEQPDLGALIARVTEPQREPGEIVPEDVEGQTTSAEAQRIFDDLRASVEEPGAAVVPGPNPFARVKPTGKGNLSAKEIARQRALLKLEAERKKASATEGGASFKVGDVDKLRKEFNALPVVKQFNDVSIAVDKMRNAAKNPTAAGDLSLIFAFMKTLDPTSTVREGEFANAQNATGVPERVVNEYNRVMSGERLNEGQRADFLSQAEQFLAAHKSAYDAAAQAYGGLAGRRGMSAGDVVLGGAAGAPTDPQAAFLEAFQRLKAQGVPPEQLKDAVKADLRARGIIR